MDILEFERRSWAENVLKIIRIKIKHYSYEEVKNCKIAYLENVLKKIPSLEMTNGEWTEFVLRFNKILKTLPIKIEGEPMRYRNHLQELSNFRNYLRHRFHFVSKRFFLPIFIFIGLLVGVVFSIITNQIVVSMLLSIGVGLIVGSYLDKKSERENKVL